MKTQLTNLFVALVATVSISTTANAQITNAQQPAPQAPGTQQRALVAPPQVIQPQPQNKFYFGMNLKLKRNWNGTTLRVVSVTPGSPAQRAGLEYGDEIRTVNGQGFHYANNSFDAVSMMNQFVNFSGGAPAVAASGYYIPPPQPVAQMVVRNVRNGQNVSVTVYPTQLGGSHSPAVAASVASN